MLLLATLRYIKPDIELDRNSLKNHMPLCKNHYATTFRKWQIAKIFVLVCTVDWIFNSFFFFSFFVCVNLGVTVCTYWDFNKKNYTLWRMNSNSSFFFLRILNYRVSHIEMCDCKWFWGMEGSIILLIFLWRHVLEQWAFEFYQSIFT